MSLTLRRPTAGDAEAVAALRNAVSISEMGTGHTDAGEVHREFTLPGHDLEHDEWLVCDGDILVGNVNLHSAQPFTRVFMEGYVHPDHCGRGIGTTLLRLGIERADELADLAAPGEEVVAVHPLPVSASVAIDFLQRNRFEPVRWFDRMVVDLDEPTAAPIWPEGIAVRKAADGVDCRALYEAETEAFRDHFGAFAFDFKEWRHWMIDDNERFDPELWWAAVDGEQIVGSCLGFVGFPEDESSAWVDSISVLRPWRRRGLAFALLLEAFGGFRQRGLRRAALDVDSESLTGATGLYEKAGMRVIRRTVQMQREVRPAAGA